MYTVLLYYKIEKMKHPEAEIKRHREVCKALQLKGRILIGKDGINGTVGGTKASCDLYRAYMDQHARFKNIDWKESESEVDPFPRLSVKLRGELVTTEAREDFVIDQRGKHVDRDTFHQWLVNGEDMVIIDLRNDYEYDVGRFKGAVRPKMKYFREMKDTMDVYNEYKGKKIVLYCTGGIRCEPGSAFFLAHGFEPGSVYQLDGGIVKYAEKYGDEGYFEGKLYVFDERQTVPIDTTENAVVVGECELCGKLNDVFRNCKVAACNKLYLGCDACYEKLDAACSVACQESGKDPNVQRPPRGKVLHRNK